MTALPRWMEPLLEAGETRELDRWAITEKKVGVEDLMERAGEGLADVVARRAPAGRIAIVCGKGNNGGGGGVSARVLRGAGRGGGGGWGGPPRGGGGETQGRLKRGARPPPRGFRAGGTAKKG